MTDLTVIDLDAERKARAAAREGTRGVLPIRFGGRDIAVLDAELPVDVLGPLRDLDDDLTLLLRQAMTVTKSRRDDKEAAWDAGELVVDILASNPNLPVNVLTVISKVATNLLGEDGVAALLAGRPSFEDYAALAKGVMAWYGLSLGESSPSSDSPTDPSSRTSSTTSSDTSDSTPVASLGGAVIPGSLAPAAS